MVRTTPYKLKPFDPKTKEVGMVYVEEFGKVVAEKGLVKLRGSILFEILGGGDIDVAVYVENTNFEDVIVKLENVYGKFDVIKKEFAAKKFKAEGEVIDISVMKGNEARKDIKLTEYLVQHPEVMKEYEELKKKYCYSKREYIRQRDKFFREIVETVE